MNAKRIYLIKIAPVVLLAGTAYWLLGSDFFAFLTWWEMLFLLGLVFMPVTSRIFRGFDDNGWMFSKVLAVAVCGYVQWLLACLKITPFTGMTCLDISGGISSGGSWNGKIYGFWFYAVHDEKYNLTSPRYVVCRKVFSLLLWWTVSCRIPYEADRDKRGDHL